MIARRHFQYDGKLLKPGVAFNSVKKQDTQILLAMRLAKKNQPQPIPESDAAEKSPENSDVLNELENQNIEKPKRRYKRRDLQAE